jgi:VanZ family protein
MDKVAHFALFAVFGCTLAWGARHFETRAAHLAVILLGVLFAASDEIHQSFVPRRDSSPGDFLADVAGLVTGYLLVRALAASRSGRQDLPDQERHPA